MIIILAIDALKYDKVKEFNCINIKQKYYGKTDISEFSEPRTMVLWSSFLTGANKEAEVLKDGNKAMWNKKWVINETFISAFKSPVVLDLPGFTYNMEVHKKSRELLKKFFEIQDRNKQKKAREKYNQFAFKYHAKVKKQFLKSLKKDNDILIGYFNIIDTIGHLNFGNNTMMRMLYKEMEEIADKVKHNSNSNRIILSDHGMKALGSFGDHSDYGFWSTNFINLGIPQITDFYNLLVKINKLSNNIMQEENKNIGKMLGVK